MRKHWPVLTTFALLILIYAVINLLIPPDAESLVRYNISNAAARVLRLSVALPMILIWITIMYGYIRFKDYAKKIEQRPDGHALSRIADGILVFAFLLPVSSLLSNAASFLYHKYPAWTPEIIITRNYISLAVILVMVYLVWTGSKVLISTLKPRQREIGNYRLIYVVPVVMSVIFAYLVLFDTAKNNPPSSIGVAAYYLPDWLLLTTIVIPYALVWLLGVQAAVNIHVYAGRVKGILYKGALGLLAKGLAVSIVSLLLIRYLSSLVTWLSTLTLKPILALLYLLIFVIGVGAVLIAVGARRLQKIEEV